jgi:hypothetical protein
MLASIQDVQPEQWSLILKAIAGWLAQGFTWIIHYQALLFDWTLHGNTSGEIALKWILLLLPASLLVAALWGTMATLYTLPFRSGRGGVLAALLMSWWDALRMTYLFWAGIVRFLIVFVGWLWGLLKLAAQLIVGTIKGAITSPLAMLDATSRRPGVPWPAFFLLVIWSAIEATIFTFTLRPTMAELLADLTGYEVNAFFLVVVLFLFLWVLIAGSFACIQVLNDAIKNRKAGQIVAMVLVEFAVALFEVLFLYRELVDAITPWLAQQGVTLGVFGTIGLALFAWVGVRGMTWFLFGRFGTPALIGLLGRTALGEEFAQAHAGSQAGIDFWKGPITALKAEREWFKAEAKYVFELMSLPILGLLAAGFNFGVVVITGKPHFTLPFRSIDDVLASTPFAGRTGTGGGH